jgi:probable phosphoglycerate mutase
LPLAEAQHFALDPATLSILGFDPHQPEVATIALWNAASHGNFEPMLYPGAGDTKAVNPRTLERWENEGGEIPMGAGSDLSKKVGR